MLDGSRVDRAHRHDDLRQRGTSRARIDDLGSCPGDQEAEGDHGRCEIDPVLVSIIGRALKAITDEMSISMEKTTRSPILCEAKDFVTGLYDAQGRMLEQTENLPILSFSLGPVCAHIAREVRRQRLPRATSSSTTTSSRSATRTTTWRPSSRSSSTANWWRMVGHQGPSWPTSVGRCAGGYNPQRRPRSGRRPCASLAIKVVERG